jgi:SAM-dependent methyltransferase
MSRTVEKFLWRSTRKLHPLLINAYERVGRGPVPNLSGDRDIEYSFVAANIANGPGLALDFGCGKSWMALLAARKGYDVTAIDLEDVSFRYDHPHLDFRKGDLAHMQLPMDSLDLIINCSSIEHVGLVGRYGVASENPDGDLEAMAIMRRLLKPEHEMLLTIPVGRDHIFPPRHRIYGNERLPQLLEGWEVVIKEFWGKNGANQWSSFDEVASLEREPLENYYGLGLFVLRRPAASS